MLRGPCLLRYTVVVLPTCWRMHQVLWYTALSAAHAVRTWFPVLRIPLSATFRSRKRASYSYRRVHESQPLLSACFLRAMRGRCFSLPHQRLLIAILPTGTLFELLTKDKGRPPITWVPLAGQSCDRGSEVGHNLLGRHRSVYHNPVLSSPPHYRSGLAS